MTPAELKALVIDDYFHVWVLPALIRLWEAAEAMRELKERSDALPDTEYDALDKEIGVTGDRVFAALRELREMKL